MFALPLECVSRILVLQIHRIMGGIQRRKKFHRGDVHLKRRWNGKRGRKM